MRHGPSDIWPIINPTRTAMEKNQELARQNPTSHSLRCAVTHETIRHSIGLSIKKIRLQFKEFTPLVKRVL
jgi:hypothetical protein